MALCNKVPQSHEMNFGNQGPHDPKSVSALDTLLVQ